MDREETLEFARSLMKEVWEPFDSSAVARFYHQDVVGHHRRPDETQELGYADVVNRIDWDKPTPMASSTIVTSLPKRADYAIQYSNRADFAPRDEDGMQDRHTAAAGGRSTWR